MYATHVTKPENRGVRAGLPIGRAAARWSLNAVHATVVLCCYHLNWS
jgi:hypothetical protein